jgi:SAM-dependent methyltransferase
MKIEKADFERLKQLQQEAATVGRYEFEVRYLGESRISADQPRDQAAGLDRTSFTNLLKYYRSMENRNKYEEETYSHTIDVSLQLGQDGPNDRFRVSVDADAFQAFVMQTRRGLPSSSERGLPSSSEQEPGQATPSAYSTSLKVLQKSRVADPVDIVDWNLRCSLNDELLVDSGDKRYGPVLRSAGSSVHPRLPRTFRSKRRYSFKCPIIPSGQQSGGAAPKTGVRARADKTKQPDKTKQAEKTKPGKKKSVPEDDGAEQQGLEEEEERERWISVDLTVVRQVHVGAAEVFSTSLFDACLETYELEMEVVHISSDQQDLIQLLKQWTVALKVLQDADVILSTSEHRSLIAEYAALTGQSQTLAQNPGRVQLFGPKLVTLERGHIMGGKAAAIKTSAGICNGHYAVTEKADGEHRLLLVASTGLVYTIDDRLNIRATALAVRPFANSLFEGEYLSSGGGPKMLLFDAFFVASQAVYQLPLMLAPNGSPGPRKAPAAATAQDRLACMAAFLDALPAARGAERASLSETLDISAKEFVPFQDRRGLTAAVKRIFAKHDAGIFRYAVDGLIFTPTSFPLGADGPGGRAMPTGTWHQAFKWKPPMFNTIDFLVRFRQGETELSDGTLYQVCDLYVAYNLPYLKPITSLMFMSNDVPYNSKRRFVPILFQPPDRMDAHVARLPIASSNTSSKTSSNKSSSKSSYILCEDGDEVMDGMIVEFRWSKEGWVPLRVRFDKTEKYYKTREIAGTANKFETALSVWDSIRFPVTKEGLCGEAEHEEQADDDGSGQVYYARSLSRSQSKSAGLRAFHNRWVKGHHLLHRFRGRVDSLADFGCGRAGDLPKWLHMSVSKVLGLDLYADNIRNPRDGAHERALGHLRGKPPSRGRPMMAFLPMDMAQLISPEHLGNLPDESDRLAAQVLWGLLPPAAVKSPSLRPYHEFARAGFDMVSCQFAVHYFFETLETLDNFAANVANFLKPGGFFVGTCLDGSSVHDAVRQLSVGSTIEGVHDDVTIWQIVRLYESYNEKDPEQNIGLKIRVYMETIGQSLIEYLVDFRLLVRALARHGVHPLAPQECKDLLGPPVAGGAGGGGRSQPEPPGGATSSTGLFQELHVELRDLVNSGGMTGLDVDAESVELALKMSEAEAKYSFLNRWFIFRKEVSV